VFRVAELASQAASELVKDAWSRNCGYAIFAA